MSETDFITQADKNNIQSTRRCWFKAGLRWAAAGVLSAVSVRLLSRKPADQSCVDPHGLLSCRDCGALNGCSLPRALSLKQFLQNNNATGPACHSGQGEAASRNPERQRLDAGSSSA